MKRRPSTRKARQEAIRKSAADLNYEDGAEEIQQQNRLNITNNNLSGSAIESTSQAEEMIKNPLLNPLSPSTEEEDFLAIPAKKYSDSFTSVGDSLFGKPVVISPTENVVPKPATSEEKQKISSNFDSLFDKPKQKTTIPNALIFSSSDSENDLFGSSKSDFKATTPEQNILSSPDDDLFKPAPSMVKQISLPKTVVKDSIFDDDTIFSAKKPSKPSVVKKSLFDDEDDDDSDIFGAPSDAFSRPVIPKGKYILLLCM